MINNAKSVSVTIPTGIKYVSFATLDLATYGLINKGSTATPYIPHEEQTVTFPLSSGQYMAEGDYLADDGIHHVMGKVIFDGSEDWSSWSFTSDDFIGATLSNFIDYDMPNVKGFCNYFEVVANGISTKQCLGMRTTDYSRIYLCIAKSILPTQNLAGIKSWLDTNKPILQYKLATETIEPYTEAQQEAWNQIQELRTYLDYTQISQENDGLPFILKVSVN